MNKLRVLKLMLSRLWASLFYTKKFERTILINVKDLGLNRYIYQLIKYFERAGYNVVIPVRSHLFRTFDVKVKNIFEDKVAGIFVKRNDIILEVTSSKKDELTTGKQWTLNPKIYFEHLYDTTLPFPMENFMFLPRMKKTPRVQGVGLQQGKYGIMKLCPTSVLTKI